LASSLDTLFLVLYLLGAVKSNVLSKRVLDILGFVLSGLGVLCLGAIAIVTLLGVISRYVFNASFTWTAETAQWLFIYLIFIGVPLAHRFRMHIAIDVMHNVMPVSLKQAHQVLVDALVAYTTIALMFGARQLISMIGGMSTAIPFPNWLQYAGIPVSCAVGLVYLALRDLEASGGRWCGVVGVVVGALLYVASNVVGWVVLPQGPPMLTLTLSFGVSLLIGVPVAFAMVLSVFLTNMSVIVLPAPAIVQNIVRGSGQFLILAIPLFVLGGALMNVGGLTQRLIDFSYSLVRHMRGSLGQVTVVSATFYGGMSGSSTAEAALGAKMLQPAMVRDGYKPEFAAATCAAAAVLPNIIPPSIGMLMIAAVTDISVGQMFMAGIGAGLLLAVCLMSAVFFMATRYSYGASAPRASWGDRARSGVVAFPVILLAVFIIISLRFGVATPTEVGAVAVAYALFLGAIYRSFNVKELWKVLAATAIDAALIGFLIGAALPFGFVLAAERVPQAILAFAMQWMGAKWSVLMFINVIMIIAGMFMDIGAAILILTPLFYPLVLHVGVDPVHFGLIVICNLMLGGLTPPVGMLAFIVATVTKLRVMNVFKEMFPFIVALIVGLLLITYVPAISLGLLWLTGH
jgi:tripartite ATP-independent transporter DctM subunit